MEKNNLITFDFFFCRESPLKSKRFCRFTKNLKPVNYLRDYQKLQDKICENYNLIKFILDEELIKFCLLRLCV